ncbi:glycoside hydrolase family 81 protein, partial [Glonium stellatum]
MSKPYNTVRTTPEASDMTSTHSLETAQLSQPPSPLSISSSASTFTTTSTTAIMTPSSENIFTIISSDSAPPQIPHNAAHPVPRLGIIGDLTKPLETNKFYANFFLSTQTQPVWTHPYSLQWSHGTGNAGSWGISISHIDRNQLSFGPGSPAQFFINPIGIQSMILSAAELGASTTLTTDTLQAFSANAHLSPSGGASPLITFPLVQGMGFVTGVYNGATPLIQSSVFFRSVGSPIMVGSTCKYQVTLEDGKSWLIYVTPDGNYNAAGFKLTNNTSVVGPAGFNGIIQIAKNPAGASGESIYDQAAGSYATTATISAYTQPNGSNTTGTYTLSWTKQGTRPLLMFALPHHVQSFDGATAAAKTNITLQTTTKGMATAILANQMTMVEPNLPVGMGFAPWTPTQGTVRIMSAGTIQAINNAATIELAQNMSSQTNLNSMYFSGKGLAKFAFIVYTVHDIANNPTLAASGLAALKTEFNRFVQNQQQNPLVYDDNWKGVVSSAGYTNSGADFGNTYYNDHHFHYGYFVYTAAVIGYLDPTWLGQGTNKAWVQMLVKDYANSWPGDYFPFSRSFDWYHGHSWAKGLYESGDGKDEESSSEDTFASYAIKMWGHVIQDANMEARGNLMLAIQARSLPAYFLMASSNTNQPPQFIGNKVTGILFENKADHA